jgi:hypothetical protein
LEWLDDQQQVYDRVHALQNALCIDDGEAMQIAEFAEQREMRKAGRPETISERFPKFLREVLATWARDLTTRNWREHTSRHEAGAPWLDAEEFGTFSRYLGEYLCTEEVFEELSQRLLEIVTLPILDAADRRFAQRAYIRVILNDFVLNPGPNALPLGRSTSDDVPSPGGGDGNGTSANGDHGAYGLMTPFVSRWKERLAAALSSAAGEHVEIPSGNDQLREILDQF